MGLIGLRLGWNVVDGCVMWVNPNLTITDLYRKWVGSCRSDWVASNFATSRLHEALLSQAKLNEGLRKWSLFSKWTFKVSLALGLSSGNNHELAQLTNSPKKTWKKVLMKPFLTILDSECSWRNHIHGKHLHPGHVILIITMEKDGKHHVLYWKLSRTEISACI